MGKQAGDAIIERSFNRYIFKELPSCSLKCLDLGSGIAFAFEKQLDEIRNGIDTVDCIDINELNFPLPQYINSYKNLSVEENIRLGEYDVVFCFEVIEHIDKVDMLLKNCYNNLKKGGMLFLSHANLASFWSRLELLFGFQPHILEASNEFPNSGMGLFGEKNNPTNSSIHHIRGITCKAMKELLVANGFSIDNYWGQSNAGRFLELFPLLCASVMYKCIKMD